MTMTFTSPSTDDYKNDIRLDQTIILNQSASQLKWMPNPGMSIFSGTFWDKSLRIFQIGQTPGGTTILQKAMTMMNSVPLCSCWNSDCTALYVGCMDGSIKIIDLNTMGIN